ncbi:hypothetical protein JIX56_47005 [Streptomyces sp. CA-210063]|uniref:hypothetical protein n=1 Tax=Streptomyces sp. CA-210063 TaxID=2801029 RepID=UPI00214B4C0D|nr:hypothetical protein [Streptomyces sp. CA-210063]UUU37453.1 hypothetical protein JIX56_47005 [Streptomyces sp. CA-210063]
MTSDAGHGQAPAPDDLRTTAKGWQGVQLAVLGFVGLCGVLKDSGPAGVPWGIQAVAGVLALSALAVACCAIFLVGLAAWPLYRTAARPTDPQRTSRALRTGIALTFTAVALLALSAATSWWPVKADKAESTGSATRSLVRVSTEAGTICGPLSESDYGFLTLKADDRTVTMALTEVTDLQPVSSCA